MTQAAPEAASPYVSATSYLQAQRVVLGFLFVCLFVSFSPDLIYSENPVAFSGRLQIPLKNPNQTLNQKTTTGFPKFHVMPR